MADQVQQFDFDNLEVIKFPVKYRGNWYVGIEANGETGQRYHNANFAAVRALREGQAGEDKGLADVELMLVGRCLYTASQVEPNQGEFFEWGGEPIWLEIDKAVGREVVKSWPVRVIKPLYQKLKEISQLSESENTSLESLKNQREELDKAIREMEGMEESTKNE